MRRSVWLGIMVISAACTSASPRVAARATSTGAVPVDSSFVRKMCMEPERVLKGERPCLAAEQADIRVFP